MRKYTHKQLLKILLPHKGLLGISRFADLSDFIDINIKVVSAIRTKITQQQNSLTQGKGKNIIEATSTALLEALERFCASLTPKHYINTKEAIKSNYISIKELGYKSDLDPNNIRWVECKSVRENEKVYIPAMEVYFPYYGKEVLESGISPYTSGLACGGTSAEATVFSILEVIERYTISKFYKNFLKFNLGNIIDPNSISDPEICSLLNNLTEVGCEFFLVKIHSLMPTYYVAILDTSGLGPKFMVSGSSCNISNAKALKDAIFEAIQSLYVVLQGAREDLWRHKNHYDNQNYSTENVFFKLKKFFTNKYGAIPLPQDNQEFKSIDIIYEYLLEKLEQSGYQKIYVSDLSIENIPLNVTKVIIPPLFDSFVNPARIF